MRVTAIAAMLFLSGGFAPSPRQDLSRSPPQNSLAPPIAAIEYQLDPSHTQVVFSVERFGFNRVFGFFHDISGEVILDETHPERSAVHARIPLASLDTGNPERDGFLRGEYWLKGQANPTIEFRSTAIRLVDERVAEVSGELSLAGVTAPATMMVRLNVVKTDPQNRRQAAGFSATGTLMRTTWGVRTGPQIGNEVQFSIEALAHARVDGP